MAEKKKTLKKGSVIKKLFITLILLASLAGGAIWGVGFFSKDTTPFVLTLENITLKEPTLRFTYKILPAVYTGLFRINSEISLIDSEIKRLEQMEKEYPAQKRIIITEKSLWLKLKKDLSKTLTGLEKEVETLYVSYSVNRENGLAQIDGKQRTLVDTIDSALDRSQKDTQRLKRPKKSIFAQLKDKLLNK